jgi:hypothetical protein
LREDFKVTRTPFNERQISIARYRRLTLEVTDPLAICLLEVAIADLETDERERQKLVPPASAPK